MTIEIESLYGYASLQATPVYGLRHFGVPPGGAFDPISHRVSNDLVGNEPDAVGLELYGAAAVLTCSTPLALGIAGASCGVWVDGNQCPCNSMPPAGRRIEISAPTDANLVYISVAGGFATESPRIGERLLSGVVLDVTDPLQFPDSAILKKNGPPPTPSTLNASSVRVDGTGVGSFTLTALIGKRYSISRDSNRVGIRLIGPSLEPGPERISEPAVPGTIQVTNDGSLVVLGPDGPTIGGYRKIAVVASDDIARIGQLRVGVEFEFRSATRTS